MAYQIVEQETLVHYDHQTQEWTIETNVFKHMGTLLKNPDIYTPLHKEEEEGRVISVKVLVNTKDFLMSPFARKRPKITMSEEQKKANLEHLKEMRSKRFSSGK